MRNPWAKHAYNGEWKWSSAKWTPEAKEVCEIDKIPQNGGYFFVSYDEYLEHFGSTSVNYDTTGWHQGYFLMFDDPQEKRGRGRYCTDDCTYHTLTVTNMHSDGQFVHIGSHVWNGRGYTKDDKCRDAQTMRAANGVW